MCLHVNSRHICSMNAIENYRTVKESIPDDVQLVAVSKTYAVEAIMPVYESGHRHFGENKVQELVSKHEEMPKDICWHLIGHLQTNKVKYVVPFVHLIHGIDSLKLLREVNKRARSVNRVVSVLLQVRIASEETKFGLTVTQLLELLESEDVQGFDNVSIEGLMGMASNTPDKAQVEAEFTRLKSVFDELGQRSDMPHFKAKYLSMGMSNDYQLAMSCGSNMVRIGSSIFGARNYS